MTTERADGVAPTRAPGEPAARDRLRSLYRAPRHPVLVDVPPLNCLMVDGTGAPEGPEYREAVSALFTLSYALHFALKRRGVDAPVLPLESLWSVPDPEHGWAWTALMVQPDEVDAWDLAAVLPAALDRAPGADRARLERFTEGRSAQVLHLGPYAEEAPTIARLHGFIAEQGLHPRGRHHEIYLGDPRRARPERLRTLLRQPVA